MTEREIKNRITMKEFKEINGDTLIELGFEPSAWFKEAISYINEKQLVGLRIVLVFPSIKTLETVTKFQKINVKIIVFTKTCLFIAN